MPIRGIIILLVLAAMIAWFYNEEICRWLKDPRKDRDNEEKNNKNNKE